jgi:hypothetical protein
MKTTNDLSPPYFRASGLTPTSNSSPSGSTARTVHTQRANRADLDRVLSGAGKPLPLVTVSDLQNFADSLETLAPASRYRTLSAVKSILAFGYRIGYLVRNRLAEHTTVPPPQDIVNRSTAGIRPTHNHRLCSRP